MKVFLEELKEILQENQILQNEPMKVHTTFRTGGPADWYLMPDLEQLAPLLGFLRRKQIPVFIIGNGSNLLVSDKGIPGAVIEIGKAMSKILAEGTLIRIQAGARLSAAAVYAYQNGLTGLEFAAGIPGSVGGAVVMNAGAYGGEMKDVVTRIKVLTQEGEVLSLTTEQIDFGYRHSIVTEKEYLVLEAEFSLKQGNKEEISRKMEELSRQRKSKQPLEYPSAGSTFKRPEGYFAGKLIMDAGLAGYCVGGAAVSEKHCGFVVNYNHASAKDVLSVIRHVQQVVKERYGVELETEVKLVGEFA